MSKKELVDVETGEMIYAVVPIRRKEIGGGFFMAMQAGFAHIAKLRLSGRTMHVLMYLMSELDFENYIRVPQSKIAEELEIKRPDVSKAIKELVEKGIIHRGPKMGNSWTYRLDPHFGWKGRVKNKKAAERAIQKAKEKGWDVIESDA